MKMKSHLVGINSPLVKVETTLDSKVKSIVVCDSGVPGYPCLESLIGSLPEGRADVLAFDGLLELLAEGHDWSWNQFSFLVMHHKIQDVHLIGSAQKYFSKDRDRLLAVRDVIAKIHPGLSIRLYEESYDFKKFECTLSEITEERGKLCSLARFQVPINVDSDCQKRSKVAVFVGCADSRTKKADFEIIKRSSARIKKVIFLAGSINVIAEGVSPMATTFYNIVSEADSLHEIVHERCGALEKFHFTSTKQESAYQFGNQQYVADQASKKARSVGRKLNVHFLLEKFILEENGEISMIAVEHSPEVAEAAAEPVAA